MIACHRSNAIPKENAGAVAAVAVKNKEAEIRLGFQLFLWQFMN